MKISFRVKEKAAGRFSEDYDKMMDKSDLNPGMGFEDIGVQSDGTPVIFDKCGSFGYLSDEYEMVILEAVMWEVRHKQGWIAAVGFYELEKAEKWIAWFDPDLYADKTIKTSDFEIVKVSE